MNQAEFDVQLPLNKATVRMDGRRTFWDLTVVQNPIHVPVVDVVTVDQQL